MKFLQGVGLVAFCCVVSCVGGALVAVGLNRLAPGYYPGVLPLAGGGSDAAQLGLAKGTSQGLVLGFGVGLILALGLGQFRQLTTNGITRALSVVAICAVVSGACGMALGFAVGKLDPAYYERTFRATNQSNFNPADVGIGLGCSEGLMVGLIGGAILAVGMAWRRARHIDVDPATFDQHPYERGLPPDS